MSNWIDVVATIGFSIGNVMVRGIIVCTIARSFAANLRLANDHVVPVFSTAGTANLWV